MQQVQAWELLNTPDYCGGLSMGDFHDLLVRAGYGADAAHKAAMQRGWERLSAGAVM